MSELLRHLAGFNRKERFFLVGWALGNKEFELSDSFRADLGRVLGLTVPVDAFVAMDYHLDWLYASLYLSENRGATEPHCNDEKMIYAQQEDIDLVVAFQDGDIHHVVLLEAKGATPFSNEQMRSKARRFREIFGEDDDLYPGVVPHFVIASPRESKAIDTMSWPTWMTRDGKPIWIKLPMPPDLQKVTRCLATGAVSIDGDHWRIIPDRGPYRRQIEPGCGVHQLAKPSSSRVTARTGE